jgi:hypothetical protein
LGVGEIWRAAIALVFFASEFAANFKRHLGSVFHRFITLHGDFVDVVNREAAHQAKAAGVVDPSPGDDDSFDNEDVEPITVDPSSHANHGAIIFGCVLVVVGLMVTLASVGYIIAYGPVVAGIAIIVRAVRAKSR